jgi:hypothetical protein
LDTVDVLQIRPPVATGGMGKGVEHVETKLRFNSQHSATGAVIGLEHDHFFAALFSQTPCCHDSSCSGPDDNDSSIVKARHGVGE